jgi:hypothetical protein
VLAAATGDHVDEADVPQLPEEINAPKRFVHTRDGKAPVHLTLTQRYSHLATHNTCLTPFNTKAALDERYPDVAVKKEKTDSARPARTPLAAAPAAAATSTPPARRTRGRDRTAKTVTGSSPAAAAAAVKQEQRQGGVDDVSMDEDGNDGSAAATALVVDDNDDGDDADITDTTAEFGRPAHLRRSKMHQLLRKKRSGSKARSGGAFSGKGWATLGNA